MKRNETRWYILWFFTSGMWLITFCVNLSSGRINNWVIILQFFNIVISFVAGIVNRKRYKNRNRKEDSTNE